MRLAIELIGVADNPLLQGFRYKIKGRQGKFALTDLLSGESGSCMSLSHSRMLLQTFLTQKLSTKASMTDIGLSAMTQNAFSVRSENTNVVQHSGFIDKPDIELPFRMCKSNGERAASHLA